MKDLTSVAQEVVPTQYLTCSAFQLPYKRSVASPLCLVAAAGAWIPLTQAVSIRSSAAALSPMFLPERNFKPVTQLFCLTFLQLENKGNIRICLTSFVGRIK